ncbi:MAG: hypothetical protein K2N63_06785 [Lachnospiraceae bacterium]|nr:hypothetical protein [Lachnospiraceae bacterium]
MKETIGRNGKKEVGIYNLLSLRGKLFPIMENYFDYCLLFFYKYSLCLLFGILFILG